MSFCPQPEGAITCPKPMKAVPTVINELLYRDFWTGPTGADPGMTFRELGMAPLDLHLLLFELQMVYCVAIPSSWVQLDDTLGYLTTLTETLVLGPRPDRALS